MTEEQKVPEQENTTTALAIPIADFRHPLMREVVDKDYVQRAQHELEIDERLGLKNQAEKTAKELMANDIDELTNSRDFYEVDKQAIGKLFGLKDLKARCVGHNISESVTNTCKALVLPLCISALAVGLIVGGIKTAMVAAAANSIWWGMGATGIFIGAIGAIIGAGWAFFNKVDFRYTFIDVNLDIQKLEETDIRIPYGAKLKTDEARETGIFDGFAIITPKFTQQKRELTSQQMRDAIRERFAPKFSFDPAIVGITRDNRMFMVVYWDIENDREKVITDIEKFKKFKLKNH